MIKEKIQHAQRLLAQLQDELESDQVEKLSQHQGTLEELTLAMNEVFAFSDVEKRTEKEAFISLVASVDVCMSGLKNVRDTSRDSMQKLVKNIKLQQSYGSGK